MRIKKDDKVAWILGIESNIGSELFYQIRKHPAYREVHVFSKVQRLKTKFENVTEHIWSSKLGWDIQKEMLGQDLFICFDKGHFKRKTGYTLTNDMIRKLPEFFVSAKKSGGIQQVIINSHHQVAENALTEINRVRSLIEIMVRKLDFWSVHIFRPLLVVENVVKDRPKRLLAKLLTQRLNEKTDWLKNRRPIENDVLAKAMIEQAQRLAPGMFEYKNTWLQNYYNYLEESKDL